MQKHSISLPAFRDLYISCHNVVGTLTISRDQHPGQEVHIADLGTDMIERLFSSFGSMVACKRTYSILEALEYWDKLIMQMEI